jgi:hypothetical protein
MIKDKGLKFKFLIDSSIKGYAAYIKSDMSIRFKSEADITHEKLREELVHAIQHNRYGDAMTPDIKNYEYEAKVFQDLACFLADGFCPYIGSLEQSNEFESRYSKFLEDCVKNHGFSENNITTFNGLCRDWTGYSGTYDSGFIPEILKKYF